MINMAIVRRACRTERLKGNHKTWSKLARDTVEGVHSCVNLASARRLGKRVQGVETSSHVFAKA